MILKSVFTSILGIMCSVGFVLAQNTLQAKQMIGITPVVCAELDLPVDANKALTQKLRQIATKNGFGATSNVFVLTANPVISDKQVTPTAPAKYIVNIDLSLYVINVQANQIVSEITVSLKGIDRLENKAMISAIRQFNASNPVVRNFMEQTRTKIIDYYSVQTPTILSQAATMAEREDYKGAMKLLSSIPDFIDTYPAVLDLMNQIYKKELMFETNALIQLAKAQLINGEHIAALRSIVLEVNPMSPNAEEAYAMLDEINAKVEQANAIEDEAERLALEEEKRRFDLQRQDMLKLQKDQPALEKARAESMGKYTNALNTSQGSQGSMNDSTRSAIAALIMNMQ